MSANQPKTYQVAMARIREQDANFAGMLRQKLEQEKRAILAERECEQYRQTLADNQTYCESMMAVRDDAIARAERAEATLATPTMEMHRRALRLATTADAALARAEQAEAALAALTTPVADSELAAADAILRKAAMLDDDIMAAWAVTLAYITQLRQRVAIDG